MDLFRVDVKSVRESNRPVKQDQKRKLVTFQVTQVYVLQVLKGCETIDIAHRLNVTSISKLFKFSDTPT